MPGRIPAELTIAPEFMLYNKEAVKEIFANIQANDMDFHPNENPLRCGKATAHCSLHDFNEKVNALANATTSTA